MKKKKTTKKKHNKTGIQPKHSATPLLKTHSIQIIWKQQIMKMLYSVYKTNSTSSDTAVPQTLASNKILKKS